MESGVSRGVIHPVPLFVGRFRQRPSSDGNALSDEGAQYSLEF